MAGWSETIDSSDQFSVRTMRLEQYWTRNHYQRRCQCIFS